MKKYRFLLLLLALHVTKVFSQDKGLILWSDFMYFKNQEEDYYLKNGSLYLRKENETHHPVLPPINPPVKPPTPIQPIPNPVNPETPKPTVEKYIFYNNKFYEGIDLKTGTPPLGGDLNVNTSNKIGMGSVKEGYTIENENIISLNKLPAIQTLVGMQGSNGGTIKNQNSGVINIESYGGIGMSILNSGYAENNGVINAVMPFSNNTVAIQLLGNGKGINNGTVNLYNSYTVGATVENGSFINKGNILGAARYAMAVTGSGSIENSSTGNISLLGVFAGIYVSGGGSGINNGTIKILDGNSAMMTTNGSIVNNGTITMTTPSYNNGSNTIEIPSGAMFINGFGTAINSKTGVINIGELNSLMRATNAMTGEGAVVLENQGTINMYTNNVIPGSIITTDFAYFLTEGAIGKNMATGVINLGEYGMVNYGGAVYNWGTINKLGSNTQAISYDGKLVMEDGGTLNSSGTKSFGTVLIGRSYTGNHYTDSGKLSLDISIPTNFKDIKSNSISYEIIENNGIYEFKRNNFEILTDDILGKYLENIYYDSNNTKKNEIFDILTSSENNVQFEWYLDEIFGRGYFPSLIYQTNDAIVFTNETILNQISEKTQATNKESYIFGYSFEKMKKSNYENIFGYTDELNSFFIGKNYPIKESLSSGWILSYTRLNSKFEDNKGKREDNMFQGAGYLNYNKDTVNGFGSFFAGYSKGDLHRNVQLNYLDYNDNFSDITFESLNEKLSSDIKNYYVGALGKISKRYNFDSIYLEPVVRVESVGIFQRDISESGGTYNLDLDNLNGILNNGYIGTDVGKIFNVGISTLNLVLNLGVKQELNSLDDTVKFKINSLGNESGEIDLKNKNRFSKELGVRTEIGNLWNGLSFYGEYKYIFSEDNSWKASGGARVKF
ncbi:autotransporter domain-containing protein [Cetobacterium sp. 2A]|uniref:autotransporter outer membrane beta-barrel domain-containing protein n=1 Tax=Cetobacterium sp. 2A TaxID=2754723 RepID=UPI00163CDAB9|nr:autotransporter outer membrane beta-barrel domain-containing protein [Cetobacterium sp. 2A]MBC2855170.1 autotransporter domain-containing protein [Cetobacterium sp. 2A]